MTTIKRRKYLINSKFQLRWSLLIAAVGGIIAAVLVAMFWIELDAHDAVLVSAIQAETSLQEAAGDVAVLLLNMPETTPDEARVLRQKVDAQATTYATGLAAKRDLLTHNARLRWELVAFVLLVILGLGAWGITVTHRIAGPMYVIKQQLTVFKAGGGIEPRSLRHGDEFRDVYDELRAALGSKSIGG